MIFSISKFVLRQICRIWKGMVTHMKKSTERNSFSGSLGFVLAAAGSAVGLGNIWRFPNVLYSNGGGSFMT